MSRVHGKDFTAINVDQSTGLAIDVTAQTVSIDFQVSAAQHDTTTIGDDWFETTSGLKGGDSVSHEMFYDNTVSTGTWAHMSGRLGIEGTLSITDGVRTISCETNVERVSLPIKVGDMTRLTVSHKVTGAVSFT